MKLSAFFNPLPSRPIGILHQVTGSCDCRCSFCNLWQNLPGVGGPELSATQIEALLREGADLRMRTYTCYGGEPLLREDLGKILAAARRCGYTVFLCSNSNRLAERAEEIGPWVSIYLASLDGTARTHDRLRGCKGLFNRAVNGIERLKPFCREIRIWSHVNRDNRQDIEELARLARELKVVIEFFPIYAMGDYNRALLLSERELKEVFSQVIALKHAGYPILTSFPALRMFKDNRPFRCNWPRLTLYVAPDGGVYPCEKKWNDTTHLLGRYPEMGIKEIIAQPRFRSWADALATCNDCRLPCVMQLCNNLRLQQFIWAKNLADLKRRRIYGVFK